MKRIIALLAVCALHLGMAAFVSPAEAATPAGCPRRFTPVSFTEGAQTICTPNLLVKSNRIARPAFNLGKNECGSGHFALFADSNVGGGVRVECINR